jgi:hypothetical protein
MIASYSVKSLWNWRSNTVMTVSVIGLRYTTRWIHVIRGSQDTTTKWNVEESQEPHLSPKSIDIAA